MSRAAHDAIGDVLNIEDGCPFGNAASRLTRETANDKEAGAALAGAFAGVQSSGELVQKLYEHGSSPELDLIELVRRRYEGDVAAGGYEPPPRGD